MYDMCVLMYMSYLMYEHLTINMKIVPILDQLILLCLINLIIQSNCQLCTNDYQLILLTKYIHIFLGILFNHNLLYPPSTD